MSNLTTSIQQFLTSSLSSKSEVQSFLDKYDAIVQLQFVSALYIGRNHIHLSRFREQPTILVADHINADEYARLIFEKGKNVNTYLEAFLRCAKEADYDINSLSA